MNINFEISDVGIAIISPVVEIINTCIYDCNFNINNH